MQDRVDEYIELGLPEWTVNTCSMGHCLITLYEHTGDERYLNIAEQGGLLLDNTFGAEWSVNQTTFMTVVLGIAIMIFSYTPDR